MTYIEKPNFYPEQKENTPESLSNREINGNTVGISNNVERKSPYSIMSALRMIRDKFRNAFGYSDETDKQVKMRMDEELAYTSKEAIRAGVDFSQCQFNQIINAYQSGNKVEFESWSPYMSDYNTSTGEIWSDKLTESDAIGLEVAKVLRKKFPKARLISLYDEYNSSMPDSADAWGRPSKEATDEKGTVLKDAKNNPLDAGQIAFSDEARQAFRDSVEKTLRDREVILPSEKEGKNFLLVSESSKVKDAEMLVEKLEANGNIEHDGEAIYFVNPDSENPAYQRIILRTKTGRWLCEALDASSYMNPENLKITHLVVLPEHFKEQQNKVWEMLRMLGIKPTNYHNVYYDEKQNPLRVAQIINEEIKKNEEEEIAQNYAQAA
ncbi:MAG: hypothetical protein COY66_01925 [Candidatus Kerfeldbacteria bacterium CG_4_10_14_0_8_um_filter_42_10]|uniref:Uncharacterized protein n=1 Tax=Candidatus Kerfeldbacteria bacterium CG_4_10_14_0_8_um_filter_42_10 TaxID=2014248 RepID=A0A2M7RK48_9BACT|nr:MAG: hypothetical protein COY66_01925 [Candidatus Kerfeldbacteria bacterium CG_4_10_14_0_8_um_filter_42_10]